MAKNDSEIYFHVHPSVVYQLGDSLITDTTQALIELVKNSFDADAEYAKIIIDTAGEINVPGASYPASGGRIIIEDNGDGMDLKAIKNGWLTISNRAKNDFKKKKKTTPKGRTPLGDKGLGRLGVQRLGECVDIFTKHKNGEPYHFSFKWSAFETAPNFADVRVELKKTSHAPCKGTKIVISRLSDIESWKGDKSLKNLEKTLSSMISPYREIREFDIFVEVDGKRLELAEISDNVLSLSQVNYSIDFSGKELIVNGKAKLDFFKSEKPHLAKKFKTVVENGGLDAFWEYLSKQKMAKQISLRRANSNSWFVEYSYRKAFEDLSELEKQPSNKTLEQTNGKAYANPGPFFGAIDVFNLGPAAYKKQTIYTKISEYRESLKALAGVKVFRDGFRVRLDDDWLKLGSQSTSGKSYYALKPVNTLGYVAISAKDNMVLEETTDREGFVDSAYFRNFSSILDDFISFTETAQEFFGRSFPMYLKKIEEAQTDIKEDETIVDISKTIQDGLSAAKEHKTNLEKLQVSLESSIEETDSIVTILTKTTEFTPELQKRTEEASRSLKALSLESKRVLSVVSKYLNDVDGLSEVSNVLNGRTEAIKQQVEDMYETVALGLTAEALSHEIFNIADQLAIRSKHIQLKLKEYGLHDIYVISFVEYVNNVVLSLRKQISFLSPSLKYVRSKREHIDIQAFLNELNIFYKDRLGAKNIKICINSTTDRAISVRMNKGKLSQIIDNFVLNSEYWLRESLEKEIIRQGEIVFELTFPFLTIWDNGRGIDPSVELVVFEPFISAKGREKGRGLGLFINNQLLDSEGCEIELLPERNKFDRLYKFQIDFRGAIND